jgi:nitrogen fixation protein NifB
MNTILRTSSHPCFNAAVKGRFGRVHLPVAGKCNILCNYCNRKYDCVNESRPGVTSALLSPGQVLAYLDQVLDKEPRITVAGIAGPGDPFANPHETMETLRLIRERYPELLTCLATNGLELAPYLEELHSLQVSHVTITVNAVDPEIGRKIYSWVREDKKIYRGLAAAELLLQRHLKAIVSMKALGITVKVNTIVIPGVNDHHIAAVAKQMAALGVDVLNLMPIYPNADTPFAEVPEPSPDDMALLRQKAEAFIPQMRHCTRCRADAVGLLDKDRASDLRGCLNACAEELPALALDRPYVAVATREGMLVNLHLGETASFQIWEPKDQGFHLLEERPAPPSGEGDNRWWALAQVLKDCRAVLVSAVGETPKAILTEAGTLPLEMTGLIELGLKAVYEEGTVSFFKGRRGGLAKGCAPKGMGGGCL